MLEGRGKVTKHGLLCATQRQKTQHETKGEHGLLVLCLPNFVDNFNIRL